MTGRALNRHRVSPSRRAWSALAGPALVIILSTLSMIQALRLWEWRPGIPLGLDGDTPWMAASVATFLGHGPYSSNPDFGAPYAMNLGWSPTVDDLHIWIIWALGRLNDDPHTVMAIYFFMGFPLAALSMYWVCRQYDIIRPFAIMCGVLFSVLPGHQERFNHLYLAAYWTVPIAAWLIIESANGRGVLARSCNPLGEHAAHLYLRRGITVALLLMLGLSDIYYVVFTLVLVVPITGVRYLWRRDWRELMASLTPICVVLIPTLMSIAYARLRASRDAVSGDMAFSRSVVDSETWSGRLVDLLLPWEGHRIEGLGRLTQAYNGATGSLGEVSALGLIPLTGVAVLATICAILLLRGRGRWSGRFLLLGSIGVVTTVAFGFYTKGGLGSLTALFITPQIRTWSRLSLFIALFGLLAVGLLGSRWAQRRPRALVLCVVPALMVVGVLDQTNPDLAPDYAALQSKQQDLATFARSVQSRLGDGCMVFNLPVAQYPESPDPSVPDSGALAVASDGLRWSIGAIRGTKHADWQLALSREDGIGVARELSAVGFCGIVTHHSLGVTFPALKTSLSQGLGRPFVSTDDGTFAAYDLRPLRDELEAELGAEGVSKLAHAVLNPVVVTASGFRQLGTQDEPQLALGPAPRFSISNMSDQTVRLTLEFVLNHSMPEIRSLRLSGPGYGTKTMTLLKSQPENVSATLQVPPGASTFDIEQYDVSYDNYLKWESVPHLSQVRVSTDTSSVSVGFFPPPP